MNGRFRWMSVVVALVMVLATGVPVLAQEEPDEVEQTVLVYVPLVSTGVEAPLSEDEGIPDITQYMIENTELHETIEIQLEDGEVVELIHSFLPIEEAENLGFTTENIPQLTELASQPSEVSAANTGYVSYNCPLGGRAIVSFYALGSSTYTLTWFTSAGPQTAFGFGPNSGFSTFFLDAPSWSRVLGLQWASTSFAVKYWQSCTGG